MAIRAVLFLLPIAVFAQTAPPAEVDQALRARVTEFFQDFVEAKFLAAMDLVASDTKEAYFAAGKTPLKAFQMRDVKYSSDFTKATVNLAVKRIWSIQTQQIVVDVDMPTTWKIENGKWVWYQELAPDAWVTPMGPSNVELITRKADGTISGMPQKLTQETVDAAAKKILQQTGVDKPEIVLPADKPSTERVVFHNGAPGSIHLDLYPPPLPGLSAKLEKADLNFGEDTVLNVSYQPPAPATAGEAPSVPNPTAVFLVVVPFDKDFRIGVAFSQPKP
jgi:hypothetical protein